MVVREAGVRQRLRSALASPLCVLRYVFPHVHFAQVLEIMVTPYESMCTRASAPIVCTIETLSSMQRPYVPVQICFARKPCLRRAPRVGATVTWLRAVPCQRLRWGVRRETAVPARSLI